MSILITGGAGFIGSHLVERLLKEGRDVIIIDDFNDYYSPEIKRRNISNVLSKVKVRSFGSTRASTVSEATPVCAEVVLNSVEDCKKPVSPGMPGALAAVKVIEKDIRNNLDDVFKQNKISAVVHLAARAGVRASLKDPILYNSVNVLGTVNLLEFCRKYGVGKFIFGSSSSVYGVTSRLPFKEDDPLENPISPYAVTKIAGEHLCRVYHGAYGISVTCLRFFTVYGPRQRPEMAIHKFVRLINGDKPIPYYGDGTSSRDYTYISDILDGVMASLDKDFGFEIINLGDSNKVTLKELVCIIEDALGKKAKLEIMPSQEGDVPITYADITKAGKLLGYIPKVNIKDGIKMFVEWYKKEGGK